MALLGYATGGASGLGPSKMFDALPYKNWKDRQDWVEEFIDALGIELDIRDVRFVQSAARARLLDPTYTAGIVDANMATATTAPGLAVSRDTMLDVLLYITLGIYPVDSNLTTAQKQALVQVGWSVIKRKGNRLQLLNLISQVTGGIVHGWTNPPYTFSFILGDGAPGPGAGVWVPGLSGARAGTVSATNASTAIVGSGTAFLTQTFVGDRFSTDKVTTYVVTAIADDTHLTLHTAFTGTTAAGLSYYGSAQSSSRPWLFDTIRNLATPFYPAWAQMGVGYSQFRAGYGAAGEPVLAVGARLNILLNEHFSAWSGANPTSWTSLGTGTLTQSGNAASIAEEFTPYAAVFDLTAAAAGTFKGLQQRTAAINNQLTHRVQVDYAYTNPQSASILTLQIRDENPDGVVYWWNPASPIALPALTVTAPTGVAVGTAGTPGTTSWSYYVTANDIYGQESPSSVVVVEAQGAATLTGANYNTLSWTASAGAASYNVYRSASAGTPVSTGRIAAGINATTFSDTGIAAGVAAVPLVSLGGGWTTTQYAIPLPMSSTRTRFACDVIPQADSPTATVKGTQYLTLVVKAISDGTATTQTTYTIYRAGIYEKYSLAVEQAAVGERSAWYPLVDAPCWTVGSRVDGGNTVVVPAVADRSSYKTVTKLAIDFPYHPALSGHGYRSTSTWTNLVKGSNDFNGAGTDWTLANCTATANNAISPTVGEVLAGASATTLGTTATGAASILQGALGTPTSKSYVGGVWARSVSGISTVTLSLVSTSTKSYTYTVGASWQLLPVPATSFGVGDIAALQFKVAWSAAAGSTLALATSYLYDVTGKADVMYPPVCLSATGAQGIVEPTTLNAITSVQGSNTLHPLLLRNLASVVAGACQLTVVPTFGAASQPDQVILDIAQAINRNRVTLVVQSGALLMFRYDNSLVPSSCSLTLTSSPTPSAGQMTWKRDQPIVIRARWASDGSMSLSAGNGNATAGRASSFAAVDGQCLAIGIGNNITGASPFDGMISLLEINQVGAPTA